MNEVFDILNLIPDWHAKPAAVLGSLFLGVFVCAWFVATRRLARIRWATAHQKPVIVMARSKGQDGECTAASIIAMNYAPVGLSLKHLYAPRGAVVREEGTIAFSPRIPLKRNVAPAPGAGKFQRETVNLEIKGDLRGKFRIAYCWDDRPWQLIFVSQAIQERSAGQGASVRDLVGEWDHAVSHAPPPPAR